MKEKKFVVSYSLPYKHHVQVGIKAETAEAATAKAGQLFDQGDIWDNTPEVPLLMDEFEEADGTLLFKVEQEIPDGDFPAPHGSVKELTRRNAAFLAARQLVEAFDKGEANHGSIDWADLEAAYSTALQAL